MRRGPGVTLEGQRVVYLSFELDTLYRIHVRGTRRLTSPGFPGIERIVTACDMLY